MIEEYELTVHPFVMGNNKFAAIKVLEEAAEVFASYQTLDREYARAMPALRISLEDEIADVIQAACNLAARYDLSVADGMERCEGRNRARGRYPDEPLFVPMRHSTPEEQELFEKMLAAQSVPLVTLNKNDG